MARNGSGVYSKPVASFVAGTTIESGKINTLFDDLVTDANLARPLTAGGTGGTSQITGWDGLTAKGTDIASAGTINLTTATGPRVDISGVTTITAVTLANGSWRLARATGIFTLTASASLIVNKSTSVNYTTAVGDLLIFTAEGGVSSVTAISGVSAAVVAASYLALAGGTMTGILNLGTVGQVTFPGTQNASSDANTLDDYEEGAWTPGITVNSSATGITYSARTGNYLKIGQFVFLSGHVALTNNGASVGGVRITGLPFTSAATHPGGGSVNYFGNMSGIVGNPLLYVDPAATTAILYNSNAATVVQLTDTQVTNTADFFFTISYQASA